MEVQQQRETPSVTQFDPTIIPWQYQVVYDIDNKFNYDSGVQEILCSGSVGSAKSLLAAHIVVKHVLKYPKSRALVGRLSMPSLKETAVQTILDHIEGDLVEGVHYSFNKSIGKFIFKNGSEIICKSWQDKKFLKFRSLKLSIAWIEEGTENDETYFRAYEEIYNRLGRLPHVKENILITTTNPSGPSHPLYKRLIVTDNPDRHVYYSRTDLNPFLPKWYITNLLDSLDPKMAQRLVYGKWVEVDQEQIYYNYERDRNYRNYKYKFDFRYPVDLMFDFNIAAGKPMSAAIGQYINNEFHVAKTYIVEGARTLDIMEEMEADGVFEFPATFRIFGDAAGKANDTRTKSTDYSIIKKFMSNYERKDQTRVKFEYCVPLSNPPIRTRHNIMNGLFKSAAGNVSFYVYQSAKDADEGLRLTKLKQGASYIEDDSYRLQHVTTALGYWCVKVSKDTGRINTVYKRMV